METNELIITNMHWGQFDFSAGFFFCIIMCFFMFVMCSLFYRRRHWSWMWRNSESWRPINPENAENILKNRLAKGDIDEVEYDNLLKKIKSERL